MPDEPEPGNSSLPAAEPDPQEDPEPSLALLEVDVAVNVPDWERAIPDAERICRETAAAAIGRLSVPTELSIVLASDEQVRTLNRDYRGKDKATNVLSFPSGLAQGPAATNMLGDVILAYETVSMEAARDGKSLPAHFRHLVLHGVLHLLGYDHESDTEADTMEQRETEILASFGVVDPYTPILDQLQ